MRTLSKFTLTVGGIEYTVNAADIPSDTSLNTYLRECLNRKGTKKMCEEGGCGVCLVAVEKEIDGETRTFSVNSCLVPLLACEGWNIQTNQDIGGRVKGYHKIQKKLQDYRGSQCGFCSSGMVMNMYALEEDGPKTQKQIENSFSGNICRCTGYRSILSAFKSLATDADSEQDALEETPNKTCKKTNCCKLPSTNLKTEEGYEMECNDATWVKVFTLDELIYVLRNLGSKTYRLIAGDTAKGLFKNPPAVDVYINISEVDELTSWSFDEEILTIGANKSLNRTIEILREAAAASSSWEYLNTIADHMEQIAGFSVRNTATIAGNLFAKYENSRFASDIYVLLETFNAKLVIVNRRGREVRVLPSRFMNMTNLNTSRRLIKSIELYPLDTEDGYKYASFKIMPTAQNASAMVNAGFLVKLDVDNVVEYANIVYGGIGSTFDHAIYAEDVLLGRNLFNNDTIQDALVELDQGIYPTESPPSASAAYRKGLALSLFYKFILKIAPSDLVDERLRSGGTILTRPVSTASEEFSINTEFYPVGQPAIKLEALAQVSGQAEFIADIPDLPDQLHAAFVLTTAIANSKIASIDTSEALALEGVEAVYTYEDIPGVNNFIPPEVQLNMPEKLLCEDTVEYYNQPVAIVVADSHKLALRAANLVQVTYDAPDQEPYFTVDDILAAGDTAADRLLLASYRPLAETGTNTTKVLTGTYRMGNQYHYHMEVQCCSVVPREDDNLDIYPASQWMDMTQVSASKVLGIPMHKINIEVRRLGGGFGAKISRSAAVSTATALAAHLLRRPVKMWLPMSTNMRALGSRIPAKVFYEVGVDDGGVVQYVNSKYYSEYGVGNGNDYITPFMVGMVGHCYNKKRWGFEHTYVKTDRATNCYMRAPGAAEALASSEAIMEHISYALDLDPWDVRMANYDEDTHPMIRQFYETMKTWGEIDERKLAVETFNNENRWKKRGLALAPMAWEFLILNRYPVLVSIFAADGTVAVSHGGVEMGQGLNTQIAQACAYKFGLELDMVSVKPSYNVISPNTYPTGGSWTAEAIINNLFKACDELLARMAPIKQIMGNPTWLELVQACRDRNINLACSGMKTEDISSYYIYGLCATEVEIDILTGQKLISRVDIIEDTGDSLNPAVDVGQVEGAFVMGMGFYTQEEIVFSDVGEVLTNNTFNYKPPGAKDIPLNFRIKFPANNPNPIGILKSKAVGEPPLCLSVSVPLALRRALHAARLEADALQAEWIPFDGPMTVEKTYLKALNSYDQYVISYSEEKKASCT